MWGILGVLERQKDGQSGWLMADEGRLCGGARALGVALRAGQEFGFYSQMRQEDSRV